MKKLAIALLIICVFNFTQAQLDVYCWKKNKDTLKAYYAYYNKQENPIKAKLDKITSCNTDWKTSVYREKCYSTIMATLSNEVKNYNNDCAQPYYDESFANSYYNLNCFEYNDKCDYCKTDAGIAEGCKTIDAGTSDKYKDFQTYQSTLPATCGYSTICTDDLEIQVKKACEIVYGSPCKYQWKIDNLTDDVCFEYTKCLNFGTVAKFSVFILLAFLAL